MVTRTLIETTCDWCAEAGKDNVKGETWTIGSIEFDACGKHYKSELASFEALVERYGTPADETPVAGKRSKAKAGKAKRDEAPSGGPSLRAVAKQAPNRDAALPSAIALDKQAPTTPSARVTCGLCGADVAHTSRAYHAKQYHDRRLSQIEWTEA